MDVHHDLEGVSFLIGTWIGEGRGVYPTIEPFDYAEEVEIAPLPAKPTLRYVQRTKHLDSGVPLHSEAGFFRASAPGTVELSLSQPTGLVEVHVGTVEDSRVTLQSIIVAGTPTAVDVTEVRRVLQVDEDTLRYTLSMAAVGHPLQTHLTATLYRQA